MRQNFKLFCCAAYILNLIVSIFLSCWPNLWCSGVFSAEFRSFRKNSANPDISRKNGSASRILLKNPAEGSSTDDDDSYGHATTTGTGMQHSTDDNHKTISMWSWYPDGR